MKYCENNELSTILIIEDDPLVVETMAEILKFSGYKVLSARSGEEGLNLSMTEKIDLLILDYFLPSSNGLIILKNILEIKPDLPVIMISGLDSLEYAVEATKIGAFDYLIKPLEVERVLLTIRNALEKKSLLQEKEMLLSALHSHNSVKELLAINNLYISKQKFEKIFLINKLDINNWNVLETAAMVGLDETTLYEKIKEYKIRIKDTKI